MNKVGKAATGRSGAGFTLIELLAVIAIIGTIAGMLLAVGSSASNNSKKRLAEAERDQLITFIESYNAKKGFYPPDNPTNSVNNPLFYELLGTTNAGTRFVAPNGDSLPVNALQGIFGIGGFINSFNPNAESGEQSMQTFMKGLKDNQKMVLTSPGGQNYTLLCVPLVNPYLQPPNIPSPWNYVTGSHATNNPTTFDLWVDIKLGNKRFRISNWNKQPQALN